MKQASVVLRLGFVLALCLGAFATAGSASGAAVPGNRCKDRCNERYHRRMDECSRLRRGERRQCEDRVKIEHDECRKHC
jgi:hypothetical protein